MATLLCGASLQMASPAWANDQDSVLMRRPIDMLGRNDVPTTIPGTPTPTPPPETNPGTPTPTPGPGTEVPPGTDIPADIDGGEFDPDLVTDPGDPTGPQDPDMGYGIYQWTTGAWQGTATCGKQSQITRSIGCQMIAPVFEFPGGPIGRMDPALTGRPDILPASMPTGSNTARLIDGVYDASTSQATIRPAQFEGPGGPGPGPGNFVVYDVPVSYCMARQDMIGPPPINSYSGTKAGCQYDPVKTGASDWELPPFAQGTASCSASAFRINQYKCVASDGTQAPLAYCLENLSSGGVRNDYLIMPEYGNFSGCTSRWVTYVDDNYCHKPGDLSNDYGDDGPVHTAYYQSKCIRSDGKEMTGIEEVSCSADDRPFDGVKVVGTCHKQYAVDHQWACTVDSGNVVVKKQIDFYDYYTEGTRMCNDAGATCCSLRQVQNSNYADAPYGAYEVVGTKSDATEIFGWYFDDRAKRISDKGEGPYFYNYGGGRGRYQPDQYVGGVIDPEPGPLPGSGGGGPM